MDPQFENIAVLTDTEADIPAEILAGETLIYTLPLRINDGTHDYRDGVDISVDEIYRRQPEEDFKTSQPVVEDILEILKKIRADGFSKVICIILSEGLSGATGLMRILASEAEDMEIAVVSSRSASVGVGILALQTAEYIRSGMSFREAAQAAARLARDTEVFFSIDTLEYLKRGGRIGSVTEFIGSLLNLKPIITFSGEGGLLTADKVRGSKLVRRHLIDLVRKLIEKEPGIPFNLVVCDGALRPGVAEDCSRMEQELLAMFPQCRRMLHGKVDATLAVHLGPNLLGAGVQFLKNE